MDYSPVEGLLHKYEMGLMYVVSTCSAHCRFCYREELIARKEIERARTARSPRRAWPRSPTSPTTSSRHNRAVAENGGLHPETGREKLREILLSGGDPMVLPNSKIAAWLGGAGRGRRRVDPHRHQGDGVLSRSASTTPSWRCSTASTSLPGRRVPADGALQPPGRVPAKDADGEYVEDANGSLQWHPATQRAMDGVVSRGWISVENQAPIIKGINDDPDALRVMQRALKRVGAENHYFFCGRDIVALQGVQRADRDGLADPQRVAEGPLRASRTTPASRSPTTRARPRSPR